MLTEERLEEILGSTPKHDTTTSEGRAAALAQLLRAPEDSKAWHLGQAIQKLYELSSKDASVKIDEIYSHLWEFCDGILISTPPAEEVENNEG